MVKNWHFVEAPCRRGPLPMVQPAQWFIRHWLNLWPWELKIKLMSFGHSIIVVAAAAAVCQMKMTYDDRYLMTVSDDYCVILWKVIDRDGRGKKVDRELAYSQEILIPKFDLQEKVYYHSRCFCCCCCGCCYCCCGCRWSLRPDFVACRYCSRLTSLICRALVV